MGNLPIHPCNHWLAQKLGHWRLFKNKERVDMKCFEILMRSMVSQCNSDAFLTIMIKYRASAQDPMTWSKIRDLSTNRLGEFSGQEPRRLPRRLLPPSCTLPGIWISVPVLGKPLGVKATPPLQKLAVGACLPLLPGLLGPGYGSHP